MDVNAKRAYLKKPGKEPNVVDFTIAQDVGNRGNVTPAGKDSSGHQVYTFSEKWDE